MLIFICLLDRVSVTWGEVDLDKNNPVSMALATKMSVTPLILVQLEGAAPEFESPVTLHICITFILSLPRKQTNGDYL